jgi:hypothetical protein
MNKVSSEQEMVQLANHKMTVSLKRPPSYSDSFFFLPDYVALAEEKQQKPTAIITEQAPQPQIQQIQQTPSKIIWITRGLSFGIHITLIGIFETVFYFLFVSKSEDEGIENTVNNYIQGVLSQCQGWNQTTTNAINEILLLFINTTTIIQNGQQSQLERHTYNAKLELQAWLYVIVLFSVISILGGLSKWKEYPIPWKRILLENLCMVTLLGLYELFFFKTIIYNYRSLTFDELNLNIVQQLQGSCNLLKN